MNSLIFNIYFLIRIVALLGTILLFGFVFWDEDWVFTQIIIGTIIIGLSAEFIYYIRKTEREIQRLLDILYFNDYSRTMQLDNRPSELMVKMEDIRKHHESHAKLINQKEALIRNTLEAVEIGICIIENESKVILLNTGFQSLLNVSNVSTLSQLVQQLPGLEKMVNNRQKDKQFLLLPEEHDYHFKSALNFQINAEFKEGNHNLILLVSEDQQQKSSIDFDAWLNFGKVITHEINNGITPVLSLSESIIKILSREDPSTSNKKVKEACSIIIEQCHSLMEFNKKYSQLVKIPPLQTEVIDLQQVVKHVFELYQQEIKEIQVTFNFLDKIALIQADKRQLEQVFINLLLNSIHALSKIASKSIEISVIEKKEYYLLMFSDNGIGIPANIRSSVFIPYFSTREKGSGIGLSLARQILWKHGASIHIKDLPEEQGCCFVLVFSKKGMESLELK